MAIDPAATGERPGKHLCSIQLSNKCWFVIIQFEEPYDQQLIEETKRQMRQIAEKEGRQSTPNHRQGSGRSTSYVLAVKI
jgi:hypothetical protein